MYKSWNPSYCSWWHAKDRCENPENSGYENYGGRGIFMCKRWSNSFDAFVEDMGTRQHKMTLDRIDNEGPYSAENCRWADRIVQGNNKRNNRWLEYDGMCKTVTQWCKYYDLGSVNIGQRLAAGWTIAQALGRVSREGRVGHYTPIAEANLKRRLIYDNKDYSLRKWEEITGIPNGILRYRIDKLGWTAGQVLEFEPSPSKMAELSWTYDNVTMTVSEWSDFLQIPASNLRWRMKNWPVEEAFGFKEHVNQRQKPPVCTGEKQTLTYNGITKTYREWSEEINVKIPAIRARMRKGWPLDQVLNFKPRSPGMS